MWSSSRARVDGLPLLVTRAQLRAAGIDPDVARRACAAQQWSPVLPGAWWRGPEPVTRRHRQQAALALAGAAAMLTGADACRLHGLRDVPDDPLVSLLVPVALRRRLGPQVRLLRTAADVEALTVDGLRCTEPGRAVVDAARHARSLRDARALVTAAVNDRWGEVADLSRVLESGPQRGSGLCRRAIDAAAAGCRSAPEAEVAEAIGDAVRRGQLPPFDLNPEIRLAGTSLGFADGWLDGLGLGWEVDSYRHHGSVEDLDATLLRHELYERSGLELVHVTPARFRASPGAFVADLCVRAEERRALPQPEPPGLLVVRTAAVRMITVRGPLIVGGSGLKRRGDPAARFR